MWGCGVAVVLGLSFGLACGVNIAAALSPATGNDASIGVVAVDLIPTAYAPELDTFVGDRIVAQVQISGTTTTGTDVSFSPFTYPIDICDGCLSICQSILDREMKGRLDIVGNQCDDNAGMDDRLCIDPNC
jgi:hypothetical protein